MGVRAGWFQQADRGTLFLDKIGELALSMQTELLRTLHGGTIVRPGGKREVAVDVRLVAATHRDLETEVERGSFRRDLYYRLYVIPIRLPSLAERREDQRWMAQRADREPAKRRRDALQAGLVEAMVQHYLPQLAESDIVATTAG